MHGSHWRKRYHKPQTKDPKTDRYRSPSDTTFFRVLNGLDADEFDPRLGQWMVAQEISILQSLAIGRFK
jgi:hypothetical protein